MTPVHLFLDDETVLLLGVYAVTGWATGRSFARPEHAEAAMVFVSIAILIPFHAINTKRFRSIGRSPSLALWGGTIPAVSVLVDAFLDWPLADILLGWLIMGVILWFVIDLGLYAHENHASQGRIDAVAKHA
jgi:uncharacterized membrane protein YhaH (DUF805 family)